MCATVIAFLATVTWHCMKEISSSCVEATNLAHLTALTAYIKHCSGNMIFENYETMATDSFTLFHIIMVKIYLYQVFIQITLNLHYLTSLYHRL